MTIIPPALPPPGFRQGVMACLPTVAGYWSVGLATGAIGALGGFSLSQLLMLCFCLYAGSAQFMVYSLHGAGAGVLAIVLAILFVNLRYLLMSSAVAHFFRGQPWWAKVIGGLLLTDETFGVAVTFARRHGDSLPFGWLFGLNLAAYLNWALANLVGMALASAIPRDLAQGLGFSLTAMFIGLLLAGIAASRHKLAEWLTVAVGLVIGAKGLAGLDSNGAVLAGTVIAATIGTLALYWWPGRREVA